MKQKKFRPWTPLLFLIFTAGFAALGVGCTSVYNLDAPGFAVTSNMAALGEVSIVKEGGRLFPFISNHPANGVFYAELLKAAKEKYGDEAASVINICIDATVVNFWIYASQTYTVTGTAVKIITTDKNPELPEASE